MRVRICQPGENVLDAAGFVSLQALRNAVALPYVDGIVGYAGARYGLARVHVEAVFDAGKCFGPNWERRADEALYGDGAWAIDSARATVEGSWGLDCSEVPTIFSPVDFSAVPSQYNQLDYWHHHLVDRGLATNFWGGFYGDVDYGNHLVAQDWWPSHWMVWSWGGDGRRVITGSHMKQWYGYPSGNDYSSIGVTVDESTVLGDMVMAYSYETPDFQPEEADVTMYLWPCSDAGAVFYGAFDGKVGYSVRRIDGPTHDLYVSIGVPSMPPRSHTQFTNLILDGAPPETWRGLDPIYQGWDDTHFAWVNGRQPPPPSPPADPVLVPHTHPQAGSTGPAVKS